MAKKIKGDVRKGPEAEIQKKIIEKLTLLGWYVVQTYGSIYQFGLPDLFICHTRYGQRWVEVKNPKAYYFTPAQLDVFPKMCSNGSGVWVLVSDSDDEYKKLWKPPNWWAYCR